MAVKLAPPPSINLGKGVVKKPEQKVSAPPEFVKTPEIPMKHNYRCIDQYGHFVDDFTGKPAVCRKCGRRLVFRYDYETNHPYISCGGSYRGCDYKSEVIVKTPKCRRCGNPTVIRNDYRNGQLFLGCEFCYDDGIKERQYIVNMIFSDV